jgi:hypothetical protein
LVTCPLSSPYLLTGIALTATANPYTAGDRGQFHGSQGCPQQGYVVGPPKPYGPACPVHRCILITHRCSSSTAAQGTLHLAASGIRIPELEASQAKWSAFHRELFACGGHLPFPVHPWGPGLLDLHESQTSGGSPGTGLRPMRPTSVTILPTWQNSHANIWHMDGQENMAADALSQRIGIRDRMMSS